MNRLVFSIPAVVLLVLFAYRAPALSGSGIIDPDYYWHLQYGDWILAHASLPTVDAWSWTMAGEPYKLTQWLGEVVMALANQLGGETGTSTLAASLLALTMACSYNAARCYLPNRLAALAAAVFCNAILVSLSCRPHQFTHLGLALLTWILSLYQTTGSRRPLFLIPPLFAVWVNLHGGYAVGLIYLALTIGAIAVDRFVKNECSEIWSACRVLVLVLLAAMAATLLNPYGVGAWIYAIDIANLKSSSAGIVDEWAATTIKNDVGLQYFLITSATFVGMICSSKRPSIGTLLSALAISAAGWSSLRVSIMMTILLVPLIAAWLRHTQFYAMAFDGLARRYDKDVQPLVACAIVAGTLCFSIGFAHIDKTARRYVTANFPETELEFIERSNLQGSILNAPETGGYLIRHSTRKVALDTRLDLYGDRALFEFLLATKGAFGWKEYLARQNPDVLLTSNNAALRQLAADSGLYRIVFLGPRYSVMIKASERPDLQTVVPTINPSLLAQLQS